MIKTRFFGGEFMLYVSHVTKKYGKTVACNDVSFHLDSGSVTTLLGPNGAGKSTLMKAIIGFLRYSGDITVAGIPNKRRRRGKFWATFPSCPRCTPI
jgi:ABC-2 type transport system ATP-binding protein